MILCIEIALFCETTKLCMPASQKCVPKYLTMQKIYENKKLYAENNENRNK